MKSSDQPLSTEPAYLVSSCISRFYLYNQAKFYVLKDASSITDLSMTYTPQEIEALHRKYAPSDEVYDLVFTHCQIVCEIAMQLITNSATKVDIGLVVTGIMLHDIGVCPLFGADGKLRPGVNYVTHGTEGESILKKEGFPETIWRFASHHTGVGLSSQDVIAQRLPMPVSDYLAETDEELLIMYADKFHSKSTPPYFNSFEWNKQYISEFGDDKLVKFENMAQKFGIPELKVLAKKFGYQIR
jgi:uncharacterized protein